MPSLVRTMIPHSLSATVVLLAIGCSGKSETVFNDRDAGTNAGSDLRPDQKTAAPDTVSLAQDAGTDAAATDTGSEQKTEDAATLDLSSDHEQQEAHDPLGFQVRIPQSHDVMCGPRFSGDTPTAHTIADVDWICTFHHGGTTGAVYVRSTPTGCTPAYAYDLYPFYESSGELSVNGDLEPLQDAFYDSGGDHHNDSLSFTYKGIKYTYYHSSFGSDWRKCQPMDCLRLSDPPSGPVTENGCTPTRTLPEKCVQIKGDGTHDPLVDTFRWCPGDPNHRP